MEFMATKGIEYLLALAYLALLIPFWLMLTRRQPGATPALARAGASSPGRSWFTVPEGLHFHRGHTWALAESDNLLRIGMDDFAHRLVGPVDALELPQPGQQLSAGEAGWSLRADGTQLPVLSPVSGLVEAVNPDAGQDFGSSADEPYGRNWLLRVRVPSARAALANLMPSGLARQWTEQASEQLSQLVDQRLGVVLADGGVPVHGLARQLDGERWAELAGELLLSPPAGSAANDTARA